MVDVKEALIAFLTFSGIMIAIFIYWDMPYKSKLIIKPYEHISLFGQLSIHYNIKYCIYKIFPFRFKYLKYFDSHNNKSYCKDFSKKESVENFINEKMICTTDLLDYLREYNRDVRNYKEELESRVINL